MFLFLYSIVFFNGYIAFNIFFEPWINSHVLYKLNIGVHVNLSKVQITILSYINSITKYLKIVK